ncbi:MAG: methyltransferase [Deltaproteobacteria bacterium]|nr:MAG: methyltransferase [Deltaproteobacteria bacterium]
MRGGIDKGAAGVRCPSSTLHVSPAAKLTRMKPKPNKSPPAPSEKDEGSFSYQDKGLGDTEPVVVATAPDVFRPTSTTLLLLRAARKALGEQHPRSVLDLGCGTGIVAVVLAKVLPADAVVCASDLSAAAVALAQHNAERNGLAVQCRSGSLFDPWRGQRFNLIVDDVSGVAEPLDRLSGWYPPAVPGGAGPDGTRWLLDILDRAPDFLTPGGQLVFPVLTLSREQLVAERARSRFAAVEQVEEQWYPLNAQLLEHLPLLEQMATVGNARVEKRGSRWCWATKVYVARH